MSTITKEFTKAQLVAKAREQIEFCRNTKITGEGRIHVNQCSALFEIALASLELELGMIRRFDLDMSDCDSCGQDCGADMVEDLDGEYVLWDEVMPHLYRYDEYTAQPAPVSVPDELTREEYKRRFMEDGDFDDTFRGGWNACRAAMLQGADGNSPVLPDGWVACSERMPERDVDVQVYCADKKEQMVGYMERNERDGYFRFASLPNGGGVYCQPTHWMPLPAAPQQGVKP